MRCTLYLLSLCVNSRHNSILHMQIQPLPLPLLWSCPNCGIAYIAFKLKLSTSCGRPIFFELLHCSYPISDTKTYRLYIFFKLQFTIIFGIAVVIRNDEIQSSSILLF